MDIEAVLNRVIGDPEEPGIGEGEARRREALVTGTFEACGTDLMAIEAAARRQDVVVAVLRAGRQHLGERENTGLEGRGKHLRSLIG